MSAHSPNNSQCDLNMYGPDPGDGSVKCTCDEDAPIEPSTAPSGQQPILGVRPIVSRMVESGPQHPHFGAGPHVVTLTGRAASTHIELQDAGREYRLALEVVRRTEARYKAALDAHMQEIQ